MLVAAIIGAGVCVVSLTAGLAVRTRLARSPMGATAPASIVAPHRWRSVARALLRPDHGAVGLTIWLMVLDTVLALAAPWPLMLVVDYGLGHHAYPAWLAGLAGLTALWLAVAAALSGLVLLAMGSAAGYLVTFLNGAVTERMTARLRAGLVDHLLRATPRAVARYPLGELTNRVGSDTAAVADTVALMVGTLIPDSAVLAGMTVITALLDWRLTLVVLGVIPLYALAARLRNRSLRPAQRQARARSGELASFAADLLARIPAVHVFGHAETETADYHQTSTRASAAAVTALDASARFAPVTDILPGLGLAAALMTGTVEVASGRLTVGGLLVFLAYLSSLTGPVRALARLSTALARGTASRDRIAGLLRLPVLEPAGAASQSPAPAPGGSPPLRPVPAPGRVLSPVTLLAAGRAGPAISMARVRFTHRAGAPVLASASLEVPGGTFTCVTGPSGSGKSTLLALLVRLADPHSGRITVDGRDISRIPLPALRDLITLVPQDPWLHTGTIAQNIAYGRPGATRAQIRAAAQRAGVAAFADALAGGLDTQVGEHGRQLSGGQQRRVAVARALLRDTPVLLLDEPTTGLDPATEARLIDELLAGTSGKTVVLVTHQPQLTAHANQVLRVEDGRIVTAAMAQPA